MNEDMKIGGLIELQGVKEEISTILSELTRKGFKEPKGFSTLKGYVEDRINDLIAEMQRDEQDPENRDNRLALGGEVTFSFGEAIKYMKRGLKVKRAGWNGKNQHIELASCISYKSPDGDIINCDHEAIGNKAIAFVGTSGVQMGWLASQADMLAEDWMFTD